MFLKLFSLLFTLGLTNAQSPLLLGNLNLGCDIALLLGNFSCPTLVCENNSSNVTCLFAPAFMERTFYLANGSWDGVAIEGANITEFPCSKTECCISHINSPLDPGGSPDVTVKIQFILGATPPTTDVTINFVNVGYCRPNPDVSIQDNPNFCLNLSAACSFMPQKQVPTTVKATTTEATTTQDTTAETTTAPDTTEKATTPEATTKQATSAETSTVEATTTKSTRAQATAEATTAEATTAEVSSDQPTTAQGLPITASDMVVGNGMNTTLELATTPQPDPTATQADEVYLTNTVPLSAPTLPNPMQNTNTPIMRQVTSDNKSMSMVNFVSTFVGTASINTPTTVPVTTESLSITTEKTAVPTTAQTTTAPTTTETTEAYTTAETTIASTTAQTTTTPTTAETTEAYTTTETTAVPTTAQTTTAPTTTQTTEAYTTTETTAVPTTAQTTTAPTTTETTDAYTTTETTAVPTTAQTTTTPKTTETAEAYTTAETNIAPTTAQTTTDPTTTETTEAYTTAETNIAPTTAQITTDPTTTDTVTDPTTAKTTIAYTTTEIATNPKTTETITTPTTSETTIAPTTTETTTDPTTTPKITAPTIAETTKAPATHMTTHVVLHSTDHLTTTRPVTTQQTSTNPNAESTLTTIITGDLETTPTSPETMTTSVVTQSRMTLPIFTARNTTTEVSTAATEHSTPAVSSTASTSAVTDNDISDFEAQANNQTRTLLGLVSASQKFISRDATTPVHGEFSQTSFSGARVNPSAVANLMRVAVVSSQFEITEDVSGFASTDESDGLSTLAVPFPGASALSVTAVDLLENLTIVEAELSYSIQLNATVNSAETIANLASSNNNTGTYAVTRINKVEIRCGFFNATQQRFSTNGCRLLASNASEVSCFCNHTTLFAVLLSVQTYEIPSTVKLLSYITESVSILCLIITIAILMAVRKKVRSDRTVVQINLSIALLCFHIFNIFHDVALEDRRACEFVTVVTHFFLLATGTWMLWEGLTLFIKTTKKILSLNKKNPRKVAITKLALGWGIPLLIVVLASAIGFPTNRYMDSDPYNHNYYRCWVGTEYNALLAAVIIPIVIIYVINTVIAIRVMWFVHKLRSSARELKPSNGVQRGSNVGAAVRSDAESVGATLKVFLLLIPVLGVPFLFGFLTSVEPYEASVVFMYINVIVNGLQGLFLLLVYCVFGSEVREAFVRSFRRLKQRYTSEPSTNQNHSRGTPSTHSTNTTQGSGNKPNGLPENTTRI